VKTCEDVALNFGENRPGCITMKLKGQWFDTTEEIQAESQTVLDTLTEKDFQEAFQK
jgi:hypothetical protein